MESYKEYLERHSEFNQQRAVVLNDLNKVEDSLNKLLGLALKQPGTMSHKVGSSRDRIIQLRKFITDYC